MKRRRQVRARPVCIKQKAFCVDAYIPNESEMLRPENNLLRKI